MKFILQKIDVSPVKILSFLPPLFGVILFSYLIKFSGFESVNDRLPILQGVTAYFSLILIGFTYIKQREAVGGIAIVMPLLVIVLFPVILYHVITKQSVLLISSICLLIFFNSMSLYLIMITKNKIKYVLFAIVRSIIQPLMLIYNKYLFIVMILVSLGFLFFNYKSVKNQLVDFKYSSSGVNILKSILLHSPFIALPLFDYRVQTLLGNTRYADYIFINKYINGFITLMFSYTQLNLLFDGELKNKRLIFYSLFGILGTLFFNSFSAESFVYLIISLMFYSLGVNLSSLLVRSELLKGFHFYKSLWGILFVGVYISLLFTLDTEIKEYKNLLYFIMGICTIVPSIFFLAKEYKVKTIKKG